MRTSFLFLTIGLCLACLFFAACNRDDEFKPQGPRTSLVGGNRLLLISRSDTAKFVVLAEAVRGIRTLTVEQSVNNGSRTVLNQFNYGPDAFTVNLRYTLFIDSTLYSPLDEITLFFTAVDNAGSSTNTSVSQLQVVSVFSKLTDTTYFNTQFRMISAPTEGAKALIQGDTFVMDAATNWLIKGTVEIDRGTTLLIEPGAKIYGLLGNPLTPAYLSMLVGSKIIAVGEKDNPIVFTSDRTLGSGANAGDWTGLKIEGDAQMTATDNSGVLRYVRIEFAGKSVDFPASFTEVDAGLRLANVGSGTELSYLQVFRSKGQGFRFNGGTVNARYLVAVECNNNCFRLDNEEDENNVQVSAWTGNGQFWIGLTPTALGASGLADMDVRDNSNSILCNVTLLGPGAANTTIEKGAIRIRNTVGGYRFYNFLLAHYGTVNAWGVRADAAPNPPSGINGSRVVAHSRVYEIGTGQLFRNDAAVFGSDPQYANSTTSIPGSQPNQFVFTNPSDLNSSFNPSALNPWFISASYIGAVSGFDWTADGSWCKNADGSIR